MPLQLAGKPSLRWTPSPTKCAFANGQQTQSKVDSPPKFAFATGQQTQSTVYSPPKCPVSVCLCHWPANTVYGALSTKVPSVCLCHWPANTVYGVLSTKVPSQCMPLPLAGRPSPCGPSTASRLPANKRRGHSLDSRSWEGGSNPIHILLP